MKLVDCVESLSTNTLNRILSHHPPFTISMEEGMQLSFLLDLEYLRNQWQQMTPNEQRVLVLFLVDVREDVIAYSQLYQRIRDMRIGDFSIGLTRLRQKGFIYTHRRFHGEIAFFIPEDLRHAFLSAFFQNIKLITEPNHTQSYQAKSFFEELMGLLYFTMTNTLTLTQKGFIHRKLLMKLLDRIQMNPEVFQGWVIAYEGEDTYPKTLALLMDFAIQMEFIGEVRDTLVVQEERFREWLEQSEPEQMDGLVLFLAERLSAFLPSAVLLFMDWIRLIPAGVWVNMDSYQQYMQVLWMNKEEKTIHKQQLSPFMELGILQAREKEGQLWVLKPIHMEDPSARAYLQPNLQILAPAALPMVQRWRIFQMADLLQRDQMFTFEITKESIERALEKGIDEKEIFTFLEEVCYQIPENVRATIQAWIKDYGKVAFLDVLVLQCRDEALAKELQNQPSFQEYILGCLSPRHLIIQRNKAKEFRHVLEQGGYSPLKRIITYGSEHVEQIYPGTPVIKTPIIPEPRVENVYPEWEDSFPGLKTIPKSWIENFRTYHVTTLVDLLKKSLEYNLLLTFRYQGELWEKVVPHSLQELGGKYMLLISLEDEGTSTKSDPLIIPILELGEIKVHLPFEMKHR